MAAFYCTQLDGDFGEVCRRCPSIAIVFLHVHSFYSMREEGEREGVGEDSHRRTNAHNKLTEATTTEALK